MKAHFLSIITLVVASFSFVSSAAVETKSLAIGDIQYQEGSWVVQISGNLPNPCLSAPRPLLIQSKEDPRLMTLTVVADGTKQMCAQVVRGPFKIRVNLKHLIQRSEVSIDEHEVYTINARNFPFSVKFEGKDVVQFDVLPIAAALE